MKQNLLKIKREFLNRILDNGTYKDVSVIAVIYNTTNKGVI